MKLSAAPILDAGIEIATSCAAADRGGAERALAKYIQGKHDPTKGMTRSDKILIADVMSVYLREHAPHTARPDWIAYTAQSVITWWGHKKLSDVRAATCRAYVVWRCARGVSDQTARHDLKTLRAAINYYHANYGPLPAVPKVTLPSKAESRARWLTRTEVAALLRAARRLGHQHVARMILLGVYTGSRPGVLLSLRWVPTETNGWIDVEAEVIHRSGARTIRTKKRKPSARLSAKLRFFVRAWRQRDLAMGVTVVCHYQGAEVRKLRRSWAAVRSAAKLGTDVTPHTLRHTATTWLLQRGVPIFETAGFVGMSADMVEKVYGHHAPEFQAKAAGARKVG